MHGGWTNRYTSDYDSKFKINALVNRGFCTPVFWSSEDFSEAKITQITLEYVFRTIYWLEHPKPTTLQEHIAQEQFVAQQTKIPKQELTVLSDFFQKNIETTNFNLYFSGYSLIA